MSKINVCRLQHDCWTLRLVLGGILIYAIDFQSFQLDLLELRFLEIDLMGCLSFELY